MATFERACQRKGKQTLGSCGENALEERRRLSDRAASETFATSVRRALRSSRGRQFLQAGPATIQGIVLENGGGGLPACLPPRSSWMHFHVITGSPRAPAHTRAQLRSGTRTSLLHLSLIPPVPSRVLPFPFALPFNFRPCSFLSSFSLFLPTYEFCTPFYFGRAWSRFSSLFRSYL